MRVPPEITPLPPEGDGDRAPPAPLARYAAAVAITVLAILSQYFVPELLPATDPVYGSLLGGLAIVYGIPILAFLLLVGLRPLRRWAAHPGVAVWEGLRWYALLTLFGLLVLVFLVAFYERLDPAALKLLTRPNPVLQAAQSDPYFWVFFSFAVGAIEETIFRGWIFGYWISRGTGHWAWHAIWTSLLFAGVHLYYGQTYGAAAPLVYPTLFLLGLAFAGAVRASGGNLWMVALLHGAHDSAAFLTILSPSGALVAQYGVIGLGALLAVWEIVTPETVPPPPPGPPYGGPWYPPGPPPAGGAPGPWPPPPPPAYPPDPGAGPPPRFSGPPG